MLFTAAALGLFASATAIPQPAMAQGTRGVVGVANNGGCPQDYVRGTTVGIKAKRYPNPELCYPENDNPPTVFKKRSTGDACPSGMRSESSTSYWCTTKPAGLTYKDPTFGKFTKANEYDRCPLGYHTDDGARTSCVSYYQGKSPVSRLKKGGACTADEIDEWGLYCTSKTMTLTRKEAEEEAISDVNIIFAPAGRGATQGADYENTPGMVAAFGRKGGGSSASASAASTGGDAAASAQCTTSSASGAAVGGALAGEAGAVVGSLLGGLGKKKKKKEGC